MGGLDDFESEIVRRLEAAEKRVRQEQAGAEEWMRRCEQREEQFKQIASHILAELIAPRVAKMASLFSNAEPRRTGKSQRCDCNFAQTPRFPAKADICFEFEHDESFEHASLAFHADVRPDLIQYERNDSISIDLESIDEAGIIQWVEEKLLAFTDAYLSIPTSEEYQAFNQVTDPVCNMRVSKAIALPLEHAGQTYYFCAETCRQKFADNPEAYLPGPGKQVPSD